MSANDESCNSPLRDPDAPGTLQQKNASPELTRSFRYDPCATAAPPTPSYQLAAQNPFESAIWSVDYHKIMKEQAGYKGR